MYKFLIPLVAVAVLLMGCSSAPTEPTKPSFATTPPTDTMPTAQAPTDNAYKGEILKGKHMVTLKTSKGDIVLELDADRAPKTVTNFVVHTQNGYYGKSTFHRVIPGFMIQGGDPNGNGTGGESIYGETFADEIGGAMEYATGTVAMANRGPDTNGSQFFIMHKDYPLPPNYTIFGKVIEGQDVVDAIAKVATGANDRPLEPVTFSAEVKE